jgi:hypothetical protein
VYSENHMKLINILHGQRATFFIVKQCGIYSNHCDLRVKSYMHIICLEQKAGNYMDQHTLFEPLVYCQEGFRRITETFRLKLKLDTCVSAALNVRCVHDVLLIQIKTVHC